ncbi:MAG: hypothetical protein H7246_09095 [Phycisphaerae bacterium]|nr:hypothetical protein [Saprospiraceae bacterium]
MKSLFLSLAILCSITVAAQVNPYAKSLSAYVGLWPVYGSRGDITSMNTSGIQHEFRQQPFIIGFDYSHQWHKRWHCFASAQVSTHYVEGVTTLKPPQDLPPFTPVVQGEQNDFEALQFMLGGGVHYRFLERTNYFLRLSAGVMGAYTQDRNESSKGVGLIVRDTITSVHNWQEGGTAQHQVFRQFMPVGRLGLGGQVSLPFAPRLAVGADFYYYVSPQFIRGSWARVLPGTSDLATGGTYQAGLNNLLIAAQLSYRF